MKIVKVIALTSWLTAISVVMAAAPAPGGGMGPAKAVPVQIHLQASSNLHKDWPGATSTRHYGEGYIYPLGSAEYFCGAGFPEEKQYPFSDWAKGLFEKMTGRADALFCVYRTKDGNFYVYDSVVGTQLDASDGDGSQNLMLNVVVDGTGLYKGATGIWLGLTEGRRSPPRGGGPGTAGPNGPGAAQAGQGTGAPVLLKIMDGYVKLPNSK